MKATECELLKPIIEAADETWQNVLQSSALDELKTVLKKTSAKLPKNISLSLSWGLHVTDDEREESIQLLNLGLSAFSDQKMIETSGDSTIHRYIVGGEICQVPHDYCPRCWSIWDFKFRNPVCGNCEATLGTQVKLLLDSDVCPSCEQGKVTRKVPKCDECGFEIDSEKVVWG